MAVAGFSALGDKDASYACFFANFGTTPSPGRQCLPRMPSSTVDDEPPREQEKKSGKHLLWQYYTRILPLPVQCKKCQRVAQTPTGTTTTFKSPETALFIDGRVKERHREHAVHESADAGWRSSKEAALVAREGKRTSSESGRNGGLRPPTLESCWESGVPGTDERSCTVLHPAISKKKSSCVLIPGLYDDARGKVRAELQKSFEDSPTHSLSQAARQLRVLTRAF